MVPDAAWLTVVDRASSTGPCELCEADPALWNQQSSSATRTVELRSSLPVATAHAPYAAS